MPQDQLVSYIKKTLEKGYSYDQIRKVLLNTGHTDEEIEKAYNKVEGGEEGKPKIKKSYLLYLLIGIAVALLVISFPFFMKNGGNIGIGNQTQPTEKLDISCTNVTEKSDQQACRLCKRIDVDDNRKYSCFALTTSDEKLCEESTVNTSLDCYLTIALEAGNVDYCNKSESRGLCEALVTSSPEKCEDIEESGQLINNQLICNLYFTYEEGNTEFLNQNNSEMMNYFRALLKGESRYCDLMKNENLRRQCFLRLSILKSDPSYCKKVEQEGPCRSLASGNLSVSVCRLHPSLCVMSGIFSGNISTCEIVPKPHKGSCYEHFIMVNSGLFTKEFLLPLAPPGSA